jgi:hypothetical protein
MTNWSTNDNIYMSGLLLSVLRVLVTTTNKPRQSLFRPGQVGTNSDVVR